MRARTLEAFLLGVTAGVGISLLCWYAQKTGRSVPSLETWGEGRQTRRIKKEQNQLRRERLKTMGFSNEEIDDVFQ